LKLGLEKTDKEDEGLTSLAYRLILFDKDFRLYVRLLKGMHTNINSKQQLSRRGFFFPTFEEAAGER